MITTHPNTARILLLDTEQTERKSLSLAFGDSPYVFTETNTVDSALKMLAADDIHLFIITCRDSMPAANDLIRRIRLTSASVELLFIWPGAASEQVARIIDAGAFDCLPDMPPTETLMARARKALEHRELKMRLTDLREHVAMNYALDNFIGISKKTEDIKENLVRLAPTDIAVTITGPGGTGKDLCAHILHHHSDRRHAPLISVDCSAPEPILSAELFAEDSGNRVNLLTQAHDGSLLLKNIDAMPREVQERLYEFLKSFTLPGHTEKLNIRLISTTTADPDMLTCSDSFHKDLAGRLNAITINLPPLRQRAEDIEVLVEYFLRKTANETGRPRLNVTRTAADRLIHYKWPGNIRELENTVRRAAALTTGETLDEDAIVFVDGGAVAPPEKRTPAEENAHTMRLADNQRELIEKALVQNDWNYTRTAKQLGIGRTTLWRKVKKYDLKPEGVKL